MLRLLAFAGAATTGVVVGAVVHIATYILGAAPSGQAPDYVTYLLNGGPFAIVVVLLVTDKLATPAERDRLRTENNELRAEIRTTNDLVRREVMPEVIKLTTALPPLLADVTAELRRREH